jgi:hypothetical protein
MPFLSISASRPAMSSKSSSSGFWIFATSHSLPSARRSIIGDVLRVRRTAERPLGIQ